MKLDVQALLNKEHLPFEQLPQELQAQFRFAANDVCPKIQIYMDEWITIKSRKFTPDRIFRIINIPSRMLIDTDEAPEGFVAVNAWGDGYGCCDCHLKPPDGLPKLCCPGGSPSKAQCSEHVRSDGIEVFFQEKIERDYQKPHLRVVRVNVSAQDCVLVVQNGVTTMMLTPTQADHLSALLRTSYQTQT